MEISSKLSANIALIKPIKENKMDVRNKTLIVRIGLAMLKDG